MHTVCAGEKDFSGDHLGHDAAHAPYVDCKQKEDARNDTHAQVY